MQFRDMLTNKGIELLGRMLAGDARITFTKVVLGDGKLEDTNPLELERLIHPVVSRPVAAVEIEGQRVKVRAVYNNADLTTGFYMREKGIFATDGENEELVIYANCGDDPEWIEPLGVFPVEKIMTSFIGFDETDNINVTVEYGAYADAKEFREHTEDKEIHITEDERKKWNKNIDDVADLGKTIIVSDYEIAPSGRSEKKMYHIITAKQTTINGSTVYVSPNMGIRVEG